MDFITLIKAAILGVIEGLTEFLPISSTAHLLIGERLLGFSDPGGLFTVMIQLGAILAIVWLYRARIVEAVLGLATKPEARQLALAIIIAFIPAVIAGLLLAHFVKADLYSNLNVVAFAFILGGIAMLVIDHYRRDKDTTETAETPPPNAPTALGIGLFQCLALIPGTSRSGATIFGGLLLGLNRRTAAEFSFFLAIPTMLAAFLHDLMDLMKEHAPGGHAVEIAVGFVFAFLSALVVVKPFLNFITKSGFGPFAWYRILAGLVLLIAVTLQWL